MRSPVATSSWSSSSSVTHELGDIATAAIEGAMPGLISLSEQLHADPELSFEEHRSAERVATALEGAGFHVERQVAGLPTAFRASVGSGDLVIGLIAEYDALPGVGHACGHNLISAITLGAALGLSAVCEQAGIRVEVLGTPAEEGGGGKVLMLDAGVFGDVHAALMAHPWSFDRLASQCLAVDHFDVIYEGRTAHASAAPFEGINAGDAMTIAQVSLGLLRQQLPAGDQIHGIVTHGGEAANVIPGHVTGRFMCRSRTVEGLDVLIERVHACFEAGALASGAALEINRLSPIYTHLEQDPDLLAAYRRHAEERGRRFDLDDEGAPLPTYSTDMANISLAMPSIHPLIGLETNGAVNHQPEFAAACVGPSAEAALRDGAIALCLTAIDAATTEVIRTRLLER